MRERLENRLTELKLEYEKGQRQLQELDRQASTLRDTLLRISGAIQVLEETLNFDQDSSAHQPPDDSPNNSASDSNQELGNNSSFITIPSQLS